jgi:hypothetical protein
MGYERLHGSKASAPEPCRCVSLGKVHPPDLRSIHPALTRATFLLNEVSRTSARGAIVTELRAVIAKAYARKRK